MPLRKAEKLNISQREEMFFMYGETYSEPFDIKCGYAIISSKGKYLVFPTENEAIEFIKEKEREKEREMVLT